MRYCLGVLLVVAVALLLLPARAPAAKPVGRVGEVHAPRPSLDQLIEADWLRQATNPPQGAVPGRKSKRMIAEIDAAGAVDGLKNGKWAFHTDLEDQPWWQVDLGASQPLGRVLIYNRCDAGSASARRILVLLSDDGHAWRRVYQHDGTIFYGYSDGKPLEVKLNGVRARFVRLQLPQRAHFYLDEVEVFAPGGSKNIALRKPATQSSTSKWSHPPAAPKAATVGGREATWTMVASALDLAKRTLAFVEKVSPRPKLARELAAMEKRIAAVRKKTGPSLGSKAGCPEATALYLEVRRLRRRTILSHPKLGFARLLINKRPPPAFSHQSDQYLGRHSGLGDGLVILDSWKENPKETVLLKGRLPRGSVLHPELSFDARKILFSYCDHTEPRREYRRFFIYEINVDGTGLRQVTGTASDPMEGYDGRKTVYIEDWDPCYLPDGGIALVSTRNQGGVRCHHGGRYCPTYTLYRCEADGSGIRPMVYGEANEWDPSVLHDGRIIWTRWDYINRHDTVYQSLWTIRPDGTGTAHFYGNYSRNPCSIAEARAIPGSHKVVGTATAHHSYTQGSIIVIDPYQGRDGDAPLTRITPETPFPETEGWGDSSYATPWPLSEDLFLAAHSTRKIARQGRVADRNAFAIYLVDTLGGRELIYRDPEISCFAPMPIVPRPTPPVMPSQLDPNTRETTGRFYVADVYRSMQPIPPGVVKSLRVVRIYVQPVQRVPDRSATLFELPKRIVGTVPVNPDGSVAFRVPAGQPLLFQLLDENGMSVMSMRSFVYLHPGETQSCVGCHESRNTSPLPPAIPENVTFHDPIPSVPPHYPGGLSFARTVQPVLDHHCIGCHGLDKTEGKLSLLGTMDGGPVKLGHVKASEAYLSLIGREGLVAVAYRNQETPYSKPMDYFAHAGRLGPMLLAGDANHKRLPPDDFQRVVDWLDLNAQFFGDYSWNKAEWQRPNPAGEKALRQHVRKVFGEKLAAQPYAALVNVSLPEESRVLKAPLAVEAGGWGQIEPGWKSTSDAGYRRMLELVKASIEPLAAHDVCGTCNRHPCECRSCWVREARDARRAGKRPGAVAPPHK